MSQVNKVSILIDGAFFVYRFTVLNSKGPRVKDLEAYVENVMTKLKNLCCANSSDILFRIFYYDCRPYGSTETRPDNVKIDFSKEKQFAAANAFHQDLRTFPQLALRLGDLSFNGWKVDPKNPSGPPKPDFRQKSVDMKIGLDIAWMSSKRIVDKIFLVAGDSDFVSPMKFARREGILIYLDTMEQKQIKMILKEHSDFIM
jgi:uncharacterized LabA/DUF88 family protein